MFNFRFGMDYLVITCNVSVYGLGKMHNFANFNKGDNAYN